MQNHRLLLLELSPLNDACEFTTIWHYFTGEDLVLAPQERCTAILVVLNEKDDGVEKLANWIENPNDSFLDNLPLFIIWDNSPSDSYSMGVNEYGAFENGVRQLVKDYHPLISSS